MARAILAGCVLLTFLATTLPAQEAKSPDKDEIDRLIKELDADDFPVREAATKALIEMGEAAVPALKAAAADKESAERRLRAEQALKGIERANIHKSAVKIADIVEHVRQAKRGKLDTEKLEAQLDRIVKILSEETKTERKLPLRFADARPVDEAAVLRPGLEARTLQIIGSGKVSFARNTIVIAEGTVDIAHADNSIIIAGIAANISHTNNCLVIAGQQVTIAHDHSGSILLSGGELELASAENTILGASRQLDVSHPMKSFYLNRDAPPGRVLPADVPAEIRERMAGPRSVKTEAIVLAVPELPNPLKGLLSITDLVEGRFAIFRRDKDGGEYIARPGQELKSPDGKPLEEVAGWKLESVADRFAIFSKGEEQTVLRLERRR